MLWIRLPTSCSISWVRGRNRKGLLKWEHNRPLWQQQCVRLIHLSTPAPLWEEQYTWRYTLNSWLYELYMNNATMCEAIFHLKTRVSKHMNWPGGFFPPTETVCSSRDHSRQKTWSCRSKVMNTTGGMEHLSYEERLRARAALWGEQKTSGRSYST